MHTREYIGLLEQETGRIPPEFTNRLLALAKKHGGKNLLEELGKFKNLGWTWLDFLEEAETCWPVPPREPSPEVWQHFCVELKGAYNGNHHTTPCRAATGTQR